MLDINELRRQHSLIMVRASDLRGLADIIKTRQDATEAAAAIAAINDLLVEHLTIEDVEIFPALLACADPKVSATAAAYAEDMGGILGAWISYCDRWTPTAIFADQKRFATATAALIGALAFRIDREDAELYPAMEAFAASRYDPLCSGADRLAIKTHCPSRKCWTAGGDHGPATAPPA